MPILIVVFGGLAVYALVRVSWLGFRQLVAALCRLATPWAPAPLRPWVERQAAWSFAAAWKKLWSSAEPR